MVRLKVAQGGAECTAGQGESGKSSAVSGKRIGVVSATVQG